jgi:hypothetical protein
LKASWEGGFLQTSVPGQADRLKGGIVVVVVFDVAWAIVVVVVFDVAWAMVAEIRIV